MKSDLFRYLISSRKGYECVDVEWVVGLISVLTAEFAAFSQYLMRRRRRYLLRIDLDPVGLQIPLLGELSPLPLTPLDAGAGIGMSNSSVTTFSKRLGR